MERYKIDMIVKEKKLDHWNIVDEVTLTPKEAMIYLLNKYVDSEKGIMARLEKAISMDFKQAKDKGDKIGHIIKKTIVNIKPEENDKRRSK